jgi:hypothetical protein
MLSVARLPGTHVHVLAGSYAWNAPLANAAAASGTATAPIVFVSDTPYGAHLDMNGSAAADDRPWEVDGDYIQVIGFDVTTSGSYGRLGIIVYGYHDLVAHNYIHDIAKTSNACTTNGGAGIARFGNVYAINQYGTVDGNLVTNVGFASCQYANSIQDIYITTSYNTVINNIASKASGWGFMSIMIPTTTW